MIDEDEQASEQPSRKRTLSREIAMQLLYQHDVWIRPIRDEADRSDHADAARDGSTVEAAGEPSSGSSLPATERELSSRAEEWIQESSEDPQVRDFARTLYHGAVDAMAISDQLINEVAVKWNVERIAAIDRAILRLAVFELNELTSVPPKVTLNEAIELAKKYSTAQSGAFINGLLDRLLFLRAEDEEIERNA